MGFVTDTLNRELKGHSVSIEEFAESSEHCNKDLYPRQLLLLKIMFLEELTGREEDMLTEWIKGGKYGDVEISPLIRERMDLLREQGFKHFPEMALAGGRRGSKGHIAAIAAAKKVHDTVMLGDPGRYYGIDSDKEIYFSPLAASLDQAKRYQFADIVGTVTGCRSLTDRIGKVQEEGVAIRTDSDRFYAQDLRAQGIEVARDFSKLRIRPLAANADTLRGSATMVYIFDEAAFMMEGESRSSGEQCYNAALPALRQFGRDGMMILQSSPWTKIGVFYRKYSEAMELDGRRPKYETIFSMRYPSWELYRGWESDPKRRFKKAIMVSPDWPTDTLTPDEKIVQRQERLEEKANPETYRVEKRAQWAEVIDAYILPHVVDRAFRPVLDEQVDETGKPRVISSSGEGSYAHEYVAHFDASSTTAGFGFSLGHAETMPDHNREGRMVRHLVMDVVKRWNPADFPGGTIVYDDVLDEMVEYAKLYRPKQITGDQFNSGPLLQALRQRLMQAGLTTIAVYEETGQARKNWVRWEVLKTAMNLDLVHVPPDCADANQLALELKHLQKKDGVTPKVEKQSSGSVTTKDVADTLREVCWHLIGAHVTSDFASLFSHLDLAVGSEGGYQIGGRNPTGPDVNSHFDSFYQGRGGGGGMDPTRGAFRPGRRAF